MGRGRESVEQRGVGGGWSAFLGFWVRILGWGPGCLED